MGRQLYADDAVVIVLAVTALSYLYWGNIFAKGTPYHFMHSIPQATEDFVNTREQKAVERRLSHVFEHHV